MIGPYDLNTIVTGDARELAQAIPDESVDLIFTDPVYSQIDDYRWLAETAARILKPDRACLCFCSSRKLYDIQKAMIPPLSYAKTISYHLIRLISGVAVNTFDDKTLTMWTPLLYTEKGNYRPSKKTWDYAWSQWGNSDLHHEWSKAAKPYVNWLQGFTFGIDDPIVFDPFTGGGTVPAVCKMLGRNYLAFEIEPETAEKARARVANTQPPLFTIQHEQIEMSI